MVDVLSQENKALLSTHGPAMSGPPAPPVMDPGVCVGGGIGWVVGDLSSAFVVCSREENGVRVDPATRGACKLVGAAAKELERERGGVGLEVHGGGVEGRRWAGGTWWWRRVAGSDDGGAVYR